MKKLPIIISVVILIIFGVGAYWYLRGDARLIQPPSDTSFVEVLPNEPKEADADSFSLPHCYPMANHRVVFLVGKNEPKPQCATMSEKQVLEFSNVGDKTTSISIGGSSYEVRAGKRLVFSGPIGQFLASGVHRISILGDPAQSLQVAEVRVLSMDTLREACAHSEIPKGVEVDTAQDQPSPLVVVRWTDERGGEYVVPFIYEPERDFEGCSDSVKEFLRHLPTGPKQ